MIGCLDVHYSQNSARAACVLIREWPDQSPHSSYVAEIGTVHPYQPGSFYLRELPCLLAVLQQLPILPEILVIDGYVWLSSDGKPGLGAHLHQAINGTSSIIGVAKTAFKTMCGPPLVVPICRGTSKIPLYITSVGTDLHLAADAIRSMHGPHRIPTILCYTDQLARGTKPK